MNGHYPAQVLFVHAGNRIDLADRATARFAQSEVPMVTARVGHLLATLRPIGVVSAAAAGADLVVLQEAIRQGVAAHLVLPIARDHFVEQSVADAGPEWVQRFDAGHGSCERRPAVQRRRRQRRTGDGVVRSRSRPTPAARPGPGGR